MSSSLYAQRTVIVKLFCSLQLSNLSPCTLRLSWTIAPRHCQDRQNWTDNHLVQQGLYRLHWHLKLRHKIAAPITIDINPKGALKIYYLSKEGPWIFQEVPLHLDMLKLQPARLLPRMGKEAQALECTSHQIMAVMIQTVPLLWTTKASIPQHLPPSPDHSLLPLHQLQSCPRAPAKLLWVLCVTTSPLVGWRRLSVCTRRTRSSWRGSRGRRIL